MSVCGVSLAHSLLPFCGPSLIRGIGTYCLTYIRFHAALRAQGISRDSLPWKSRFQPYAAWYGMILCYFIAIFSGFGVFIHGHWNTSDFFAQYVSLAIFVLPAVIWKVIKRTKVRILSQTHREDCVLMTCSLSGRAKRTCLAAGLTRRTKFRKSRRGRFLAKPLRLSFNLLTIT